MVCILWFYLGLRFLGSSLYRFVSFFYPFKKPSDLLHILSGFSFISDLTFILSVLCMYCCIVSVLLLMFSLSSRSFKSKLFPLYSLLCIVSFLNLQFHSGETGSHPHSPGRPQWMWKFPDFPCWDYRHGPPHWDLYFWPSTWSFLENAAWTWMCTLQLQQTFCKCSSASEYGSTQSSRQSEVPGIIILEYILPLEIIFALNIWWFHLRYM